MEKTENQVKFVDDFKTFIDSIELNENFDLFVKKFRKHKYFEYCAKTIQKLLNDEEYGKQGVKLFIFCSFTRDRETCEAIIQLLGECNLKEQAIKLKQYNTSVGPMPLDWANIELKVATRPSPFKQLSNAISLLRKPRGKCIIINNVEDAQSPPYYDHGQLITPIGLKRETERFRHIFTELYFEVQVLTKLSAEEMKKKLNEISRHESLKNDEAFILIVISHGQDEAVLGYNACEAMRKIAFKQIERNNQEAIGVIESDKVSTEELVAIFSQSPHLNSKPKLHFYICCRDKNKKKQGSEPKVVINENKPKGKEYADTFIAYACAEGYESYYDAHYGLSYFGQALTHSIAQYACDYHLGDIMTRTSQRLRKMYSQWESSANTSGSYAIQVNTYAMSFQLYFNPGHHQSITS